MKMSTNGESSKLRACQTIFKGFDRWSLCIGVGAAIVLLGCLAIILPVTSEYDIDDILAWILLIAGIIYSIYLIQMLKTPSRLPNILEACLYLLIGIFLFFYHGIVPLTFLLLMFFLAGSVLRMMRASELDSKTGRGAAIGAAILDVFFAILVALGYPSSAGWAYGMFIGLDLMIWGLSIVKSSLRMKTINEHQ